MKRLPVITILGVIALQMSVFVGSWAACVSIARSMGRFPPTFFHELRFISGMVFFGLLCAITSSVSAVSASRSVRWTNAFVWLAIWATILFNARGDRPVAMPVFIALGAVVMLAGSRLIRYLRRGT